MAWPSALCIVADYSVGWSTALLACRYMLTAIYLGRGALSCLLLMGLGESTSLLQNGWYMARFLRQDYKACAGATCASDAPGCMCTCLAA